VNNWNTREFTSYVRERTNNIILCRDHGGTGQGNYNDGGMFSFLEDAKYMDIIHIDPWKKLNFKEAVAYTIDIIKMCSSVNDSCLFEVGTEQAIYPMNPHVFEVFIETLKEQIPDKFHKIIYGVIQSGTSLEAGNNTGTYSKESLKEMSDTCRRYSILSKEHNGDYLSASLIKEKFNLGLSAINIAPEIANLETKYVLENISVIELWFTLLMEDGRWKKWFPENFDPRKHKARVLELCGHYVFSHPKFNFDLESVYELVSADIFSFIKERI